LREGSGKVQGRFRFREGSGNALQGSHLIGDPAAALRLAAVAVDPSELRVGGVLDGEAERQALFLVRPQDGAGEQARRLWRLDRVDLMGRVPY